MASFSKAFAAARKELGPGKTFTWNGKKYSTNRADDKKPAKASSEVKSSPRPVKNPRDKPPIDTPPKVNSTPPKQPTPPKALTEKEKFNREKDRLVAEEAKKAEARKKKKEPGSNIYTSMRKKD